MVGAVGSYAHFVWKEWGNGGRGSTINQINCQPSECDFMTAAGAVGNFACDRDVIVKLSPDTSSTIDVSIEAPDPPMATSNKAARVGGKDRKGVIDSSIPTFNDGSGTMVESQQGVSMCVLPPPLSVVSDVSNNRYNSLIISLTGLLCVSFDCIVFLAFVPSNLASRVSILLRNVTSRPLRRSDARALVPIPTTSMTSPPHQ